ncbi:GNAT family N-acetyltransferase [Aquabacterium humicola]|uniref:GNAT family N-acetyltransferase n=1 Tax=Aquabacterium humicola TaxID=3237377 RepID=UPI002542BF03|nr:GNAT family N-acetyltransferase [Rubrivivax pictus]
MTASIDAHGPSDPQHADRNQALGAALPPDAPAKKPPERSWIPIRSLGPAHRPRILEHLLSLSEHDRYLRFGFPATDAQIERYVDGLDFDRDEVFGVFNRKLKVIALAHLAYAGDGYPADTPAEFGGSVAEHLRGRGFGARLFEHAMLHARNRGIDKLFIHALSENTAMLRIARKAGATVQRSGGESDATLTLPPETLASQVEQLVGESAAAIDYQLKQQARAVENFIDALVEVRSGVGKSGPAGG